MSIYQSTYMNNVENSYVIVVINENNGNRSRVQLTFKVPSDDNNGSSSTIVRENVCNSV